LIALLSDDSEIAAVCAGAGSEHFVAALIEDVPGLEGRVHATGRSSASETAVILSACDLLLQPYLDGVTTRRTSVMAGLINGRPILTTTGHLTEPLWADTRPVALTQAGDTTAFVTAAHKLLADPAERMVLGARAEKTYRERFALVHTIERLREAVKGAAA
jgi:glycosyltransferase involved in cell wall biosynthesis